MSELSSVERSSSTAFHVRARALIVCHPLRQSLIIALLWRIVVGAAGGVGDVFVPRGTFTHFSLIRNGRLPSNPIGLAIDAGIRSDALWYARIVQHGYTFSTRNLSSVAFYPLYPLLVKSLSLVTGNVFVAGMIASTACLFAAIPLFHAWMQQRGLGHRTPVALLCLLFFPWSLFYAAMYSESLYLLLAVGTFLWYERAQWRLAAACTFLLALDRPTGVLIVPALGVLFYGMSERRCAALLPLATGIAGVGILALIQWIAFSSPVASWQAATVPPWSRGLHQALLDVTLHARYGFPSWYVGFMLAVGLIVLAAVPMVNRRLGPAYALYAALTVILPAASGLVSLERYVITDFPVFVALSCTSHNRLLMVLLVVEFYFLVLLAGAFAAGWAVF
jgi:Mannosyltransferase (PIG-V)